MSTTHYLAVDLGAESGRVMLGTLADGVVSLEEVHRFPNRVLTVDGHLRWDLAHLETEIFAGIEKGAQRGIPISGISTDSWGIDYVLLNAEGEAAALPFCYRDSRTEEGSARMLKKLPFAEIYRETGIQYMAFNTLYQFQAEVDEATSALKNTQLFLFIADYFNARLSGVKVVDESNASTTQMYDPRTHDWSGKLISALGISKSIFPPIVPCGTVLGPVIKTLRQSSPLSDAKVVATCSHDTGVAVAAVPAQGQEGWAYLSSGTWSLLGAELPAPVLTDAACEAGFTNEVGLGGTIRFLKNIAGLWVLQECRRAWEAEGRSFNYDELTRLGVENGPAAGHLSLKDPRFVSAGDMPAKIAAYCRETDQPVPEKPGQFVRTILESLALTYGETLQQLERLVGRKMEKLHIVGGGSRNDLLNQLTADATGLTIVTGPVEGSAIGNVLIQALALGHLESAGHLRRVVSASFPTRTFQPQGSLRRQSAPAFTR